MTVAIPNYSCGMVHNHNIAVNITITDCNLELWSYYQVYNYYNSNNNMAVAYNVPIGNATVSGGIWQISDMKTSYLQNPR